MLYLSLILMLFAGCRVDKTKQAYLEIKQSGRTGVDLLEILSVFEMENSSHFESKVDLGSYYLLAGNLAQAKYYLIRAESVIENAENDKVGKKTKSILWGSMAYLSFIDKNYPLASRYVDKAIKSDYEAGKKYLLLKAHVLYAMNSFDLALALFDAEWKSGKENFKAEDLRAYMYLLAEKKRYAESVSILDQYMQTGDFYGGLGLFASSVYEQIGDQQKAVLYAYVEYQFSGNDGRVSDSDFLGRLGKLEKTLVDGTGFSDIRNTISLVQSRFDSGIPYASVMESDGFIERRIKLANKIRDNKLLGVDLDYLLSLEGYYKYFPDYYIDVWKAVSILDPSRLPQFRGALEKALYLDTRGLNTIFIKRELGKNIGLKENECQKILTLFEIQKLMELYSDTGDISDLGKVFDLLNLPDNVYGYETTGWLKSNLGSVPGLRADLARYASVHFDKASERIHYILEK